MDFMWRAQLATCAHNPGDKTPSSLHSMCDFVF